MLHALVFGVSASLRLSFKIPAIYFIEFGLDSFSQHVTPEEYYSYHQ
jgi:hypothetical protein